MYTQKTNIIVKRVIFIFLVFSAFAAQSFAQDKIYVWEKNGNVTGYNVTDIDSISFTAPYISTIPFAPQINAVVTGNTFTGTITSYNNLKVASLTINGFTVTGWPITDFGAGRPIIGQNGQYFMAITGLATGNYALTVTDMSDISTSRFFQIDTGINWSTGSNTITANGTYYYKQGSKEGEIVVTNLNTSSVIVSLDGKPAVTLSDAGTSYLLKDGTASFQSGVDAFNFLLAKRMGEAKIINADGLASPIPGAENVIFVFKQ